MSMDFDFSELFANSERLKSNNHPSDDALDIVDEFFDEYYSSEEEEDDDDSWMEEFRLRQANRSTNQYYNIGLTQQEKNDLIAEGKTILLDFYKKAAVYEETTFEEPSIKPAPVNFFPFENEEHKLQRQAEEMFEPDQEEGFSSLDAKVFSFSKDSVIQATVKLLHNVYDTVETSEDHRLFKLNYDEFISNFAGSNYKYNRFDSFSKLKFIKSAEDKNHLTEILSYEEKETKPLKNVFIIYITSGGGKTTLYKKYKNYFKFLDVDQFIKENYTSFKLFSDYISGLDKRKQAGISNLWFKYQLYQRYKDGGLENVIMLFNHPNQVPLYFRRKYNELIIIPSQLNWQLRFFKENYFSLICVKNKHKVLLDYSDYMYYSVNYFMRHYTTEQFRSTLKKEIYNLKPEGYYSELPVNIFENVKLTEREENKIQHQQLKRRTKSSKSNVVSGEGHKYNLRSSEKEK